jgi:hypothetical protein
MRLLPCVHFSRTSVHPMRKYARHGETRAAFRACLRPVVLSREKTPKPVAIRFAAGQEGGVFRQRFGQGHAPRKFGSARQEPWKVKTISRASDCLPSESPGKSHGSLRFTELDLAISPNVRAGA